MNILVKMSTEEQMHYMTEQFKALDKDGTGMINCQELKDYIEKYKLKISDNEILQVIGELNYAGDAKIHYSEFLAAMLDIKTFFNDAKLLSVFSLFDTDGNGKISEDNMHFAF